MPWSGSGLLEEIELDGGQIVNPTLADYMIPSPRRFARALDGRARGGSGGGRVHGLGETGAPPVPAAIGNALFHATGVRLTTLPLTPEKVLAGLREAAAARRIRRRSKRREPGMTAGTGWQAAVAEGDQRAVRCVLMRGGTSRGAFLLAEDLPTEPALRDRVSSLSTEAPTPVRSTGSATWTAHEQGCDRVAVGPPGADVDYPFGQVRIEEPVVDYRGNCGNMLAAVGPFAIDEGIVRTDEPITQSASSMSTRDGSSSPSCLYREVVLELPAPPRSPASRAPAQGSCSLLGHWGNLGPGVAPDGAPTRAARARRRRCRQIFIVDAGAPAVFVAARELGLAGEAFVARPLDRPAIERLKSIRAVDRGAPRARLRSGRAGRGDPGVLKVYAVQGPVDYVDSLGRSISAKDATLAGRGLSMGRTPRRPTRPPSPSPPLPRRGFKGRSSPSTRQLTPTESPTTAHRPSGRRHTGRGGRGRLRRRAHPPTGRDRADRPAHHGRARLHAAVGVMDAPKEKKHLPPCRVGGWGL